MCLCSLVLKSPAAVPAECLIERGTVRLLGCCADPIVQELGILADENAPFLRLHGIEDDGCCLCSSRGRVFAKAPLQFQDPCPDLIVGIIADVDTLHGEPFARRGYVDRRHAAP